MLSQMREKGHPRHESWTVHEYESWLQRRLALDLRSLHRKLHLLQRLEVKQPQALTALTPTLHPRILPTVSDSIIVTLK